MPVFGWDNVARCRNWYCYSRFLNNVSFEDSVFHKPTLVRVNDNRYTHKWVHGEYLDGEVCVCISGGVTTQYSIAEEYRAGMPALIFYNYGIIPKTEVTCTRKQTSNLDYYPAGVKDGGRSVGRACQRGQRAPSGLRRPKWKLWMNGAKEELGLPLRFRRKGAPRATDRKH